MFLKLFKKLIFFLVHSRDVCEIRISLIHCQDYCPWAFAHIRYLFPLTSSQS